MDGIFYTTEEGGYWKPWPYDWPHLEILQRRLKRRSVPMPGRIESIMGVRLHSLAMLRSGRPVMRWDALNGLTRDRYLTWKSDES